MDLHRGGGFTQERWIYTGAVDLHSGGGAVGGGRWGGGRWIYKVPKSTAKAKLNKGAYNTGASKASLA